MLVDPSYKKGVVYIGYRYLDQTKKVGVYFGGTAFFVSIMLEKSKKRVTYLVTAKHNIDGIMSAKDKIDNNSIVRINKLDGDSQFFNIPLEAWRFHPTEKDNVDVAVVTIKNLSQSIYDYLSIPAEWFIPKDLKVNINGEMQKVTEGEDLFIIGLFKYHSGNKKNYPIIRTGNIALLPEEKVFIDKKIKEADVYLIESRSIKGLSGSPVFLSLGLYGIINNHIASRAPGTNIFYWFGLISGHFITKDTEVDFDSLNVTDEEKLNVGISFVVPAYKIVETLNAKDLVEERNKFDDISVALKDKDLKEIVKTS